MCQAMMQPPARGAADPPGARGDIVQDIDGQDRPAAMGSVMKGRIVGQAQVLSEPDDGGRGRSGNDGLLSRSVGRVYMLQVYAPNACQDQRTADFSGRGQTTSRYPSPLCASPTRSMFCAFRSRFAAVTPSCPAVISPRSSIPANCVSVASSGALPTRFL